MLLHPVISAISSRRDQLSEAILKGHLSSDVGRYLSPGWAYVYKEDGTPSLAFASTGNSLDEMSLENDGAIAYVVTTDDEDRDGDIVVPKGGYLKNYSRNPVVFFGHQEWEIPIGVCRSPDGRVTVFPQEGRMVDLIYFDREDPDADFVYQKCQRKILNATSIAFVPIEAWRRDDVRKARTHGDQQSNPPGWYFNQWDKTEVSIVGVPSNPKAVGLEKDLMGACRDAYDREKGFMSMKLQKAWQPYCATAKGCWNGWCPLPGDEKGLLAQERSASIGGGVVLKAVEKAALKPKFKIGDAVENTYAGSGNPTYTPGKVLEVSPGTSARPSSNAFKPGKPGTDTRYRVDFGNGRSGWVDEDALESATMKSAKSAEPAPEMDFAVHVQEAGKELENHKNPAPMPGYGQIFRGPNDELWYVGGDGDEDGFYDLVLEKLQPLTVGEVVYEAESFPPEDQGWEQLYPEKSMKTKTCSCADCSAGKACRCGKSVTKAIKPTDLEVRGNEIWLNGKRVSVLLHPPTEENLRRTAELLSESEESKGLSIVETEEKAQPSDDIDPEKACKILRDGEVDGQPLTDDQRGMFGAACARAQKSWGGLRETCKALVKAVTQADLDSPGTPGRNANPDGTAGQEKTGAPGGIRESYRSFTIVEERDGGFSVYRGGVRLGEPSYFSSVADAKAGIDERLGKSWKALSQSDGRVGGYVVLPGGVQSDAKQDPLNDPQTPTWTTCETCHGDGNCGACDGVGTSDDDANCPECGGSGECGACAGEGHVQKRGKKIRRKQLDGQAEDKPQLSTPQVLAALYSHAKAEAAYLDQLDDQYKDQLADYRRQQVEERMDMLKYQFSRSAREGDDLEKMCKAFEDEHDKGMESTGPDQTVEPGEAGLVEQGQVPPEEDVKDWDTNGKCPFCGYFTTEPPSNSMCPECGKFSTGTVKSFRKGRTMKQNTVPAEGAYTEDDPEAKAELDAGAAPFNKAAPGTDEWAEEEAAEPEHKAANTETYRGFTIKEERDGSYSVYKNGQVVDEPGYFSSTAEAKEGIDERLGKSADEETTIDKEEDDAEEKGPGSVCMCGMEVPDGATECPGCGAPVEKVEQLPEEELKSEDLGTCPKCRGRMIEGVTGPTCVDCGWYEGRDKKSIEGEETPPPAKADGPPTDPSTEEILERYQHPKTLKWSTRKHRVSKALLTFLKFRKAANGKKYLVRAKDDRREIRVRILPALASPGKWMVASAQTGYGLQDLPKYFNSEEEARRAIENHPGGQFGRYVEVKSSDKPTLDDSEVKALTTKLAGAIDDLKALVRAKDIPRQYKAGLKHVADQIWYVGKALTDKGKEQRNGGGGSELTDKGKVQANGGGGGELKDKGEQQGKSPTKSAGNGKAKQVSPAVEAKFNETMAKLQRFGVLNGVQ